MAGFNLTAQINLRGPGNVKKVVAGIQKQLSGLKADVNLNIGKGTLNTLQSANKKLLAINSSLQKVSSNAKQANAAVGQFAQTINSIGTGNVSVKIQAASKATQQLGKNAGITFKNLKVARTEIEEFGRQSALAIRRFTAFASVTSVIYGVNNAINQALSDFIKFDRQLVRIAQVSGQTVGNLKGLQGTIGELATGIGVSSSSLAEVSVTLTQAGFSIREVQKALKALALTDVAPTFNNLNDTVQGSIALLRQFSIGTGQLEASLSSINAVAAQFAVESSDIISAIQRAGGVFAAASRGVSEGTDALNEFIAIFTSVRATTREGAETIATGLRTIFTRLQRESTIDALKEFGVNLQDAEGKFVGAYKAVQLLSEGLGSLDPRDIRFSKIVEELGGFRQIGKVIPLIGQFATAQEALRVAQTGQDSLAKSNAQAQAALAVQFARVREEFLKLVRDVAGTDSFKGLISGALSLASAMIKVADAVKGVIPIIGLLAAAKGASAITQFARGFGGGLRRTQGFARGGTVPGSGNTDSVPAMLTPGEFVLRKSAVKAIGTEKLHKMNNYAYGGTVKNLSRYYPSIVKKTGYEKIKDRKLKDRSVFRKISPRTLSETEISTWQNSTDPDWMKFEKLLEKKYNTGPRAENLGQSRFAILDFPETRSEAKFLPKNARYGDNDSIKGNNPGSIAAKNLFFENSQLTGDINEFPNILQTTALSNKPITTYWADPREFQAKLTQKASGGSVQDTVPAMLTPGEFVMNAKSAKAVGYGNLRKMNTRPQGFNKGGVVGYANGGLTGVRGGDIRIGSGLTGQLEALEQAFISLGLPVDQITKAVNNNGKVSRQTYLEFSKQAKANVRLAKASAQTTAERKKAELVEKQLAAVRSGVAQQKTGSALVSNANSFANSQAFTSLILGAGGAAVALESLNTPLTSFGSTLISSTASFVTAMVAATSAASNFARTGFAQKIGGALGKIPGLAKLGGVFLKAIPVVGAVTTAFGLVTGVVQAYYSYQRKQIALARELTKAGLERATESAAKALEKFSKDASAINFAEVNRRIADQIAAGNADAEQIGKSVRLERQDTTGISGTMRELGAYITFGYIDSIEDATRQNEDKVKAAAKQLADTYAPALQNAQNVVFQKLAAGATIKDLENAPAGSEEAKALNNLVEAALAADQTYQEQVALAAQQGKQLTAQQIDANRKRIRSELLTGNGTIALRDKLEQAARAQERLGRLQARLATSFEKLNNAVQQSANLINFEAETRQSAIDSSIAAARGEASITEIRSRTANVLDNPLAYTPGERADTRAELTRNLTPALGESRAREVSALSTFDAAAIEKSFADVANNVAVAAAPSEISEQIQDNLALEIDKLRAAGATDAANNLQQQANEAASVLAQKLKDEQDPTKRQTLIDETLENLKKNFNEVRNQAVNLAKTFEQTRINAFNQFAKNLAQAANLQNEALKYQQAAINASRNASDSINEALTGFGPSVRELTARQDADTARLTGGPTDPAGIKANFDALKASSSSLQQAFDEAVAAGDTAEAERLARELTAVNNQLNNNRAALERLAESASKAAEAALAEVNERKRLQDANRQFAETLLTSGPEELKKLDESLVRANQRVNGFMPQAGASQRKRFFELLKQTGSVQQASQGVAAETRAEDLKFLQQTRDVRIMNMQDMGMTLEEATQRANQDESRILGQMGREAGLGRLGRQIVGRAVATTADRRNDPVMRDLITQYQNAAVVQQQANEQLSLIASGAANEALVKSQENLRTSIDDLNARIAGADIRSRPDGVNPGRGQVPAYRAAGGSIFQPRGTDTVPAMLTPGEFVVNRKATQKNMGLLQAINGGQVNTYSKGAKVLYLRGGGFAARDTNKDGVITVGVEDASGLTDTNNDGRISFAEYMNTQSINDPRMKDAVNKINQRLVKTGNIQNPQQYLAHEQYVDMIETFGPIAEELANYATQKNADFLKRYKDYKAHMESGMPNGAKAREQWFKKRDEFLSDSAFAWYAKTAENTDPTGQKTSDFLVNVASGKARAPGIFQIGNRALGIYQQKFDENIKNGMNPNDAREGALDYLYTDTALAAYPGTREAVTRMAERRDTYRAISGGGGDLTRLRASHQAGLQAARKAQREGRDPQKAYNESRDQYLKDKAQEYKDRRIKQHIEGRGAKPLSNQELKDMGYDDMDIGLMNAQRWTALSQKEGTEQYKMAQEAKRNREKEESRKRIRAEIEASLERAVEEGRREDEARAAASKKRLEEFKASPEGQAFQAEIDQRMQKVRDDFDAKRAAEKKAADDKYMKEITSVSAGGVDTYLQSDPLARTLLSRDLGDARPRQSAEDFVGVSTKLADLRNRKNYSLPDVRPAGLVDPLRPVEVDGQLLPQQGPRTPANYAYEEKQNHRERMQNEKILLQQLRREEARRREAVEKYEEQTPEWLRNATEAVFGPADVYQSSDMPVDEAKEMTEGFFKGRVPQAVGNFFGGGANFLRYSVQSGLTGISSGVANLSDYLEGKTQYSPQAKAGELNTFGDSKVLADQTEKLNKITQLRLKAASVRFGSGTILSLFAAPGSTDTYNNDAIQEAKEYEALADKLEQDYLKNTTGAVRAAYNTADVAADFVLDPTTYVGVGAAAKSYKALSEAQKAQFAQRIAKLRNQGVTPEMIQRALVEQGDILLERPTDILKIDIGKLVRGTADAGDVKTGSLVRVARGRGGQTANEAAAEAAATAAEQARKRKAFEAAEENFDRMFPEQITDPQYSTGANSPFTPQPSRRKIPLGDDVTGDPILDAPIPGSYNKRNLTTSSDVSVGANAAGTSTGDVTQLPGYKLMDDFGATNGYDNFGRPLTAATDTSTRRSITIRGTNRKIPEGPLDTRDPTVPIQQTSETISAGAIPGTGPIDVSAGSMRGAGTIDVQSMPTRRTRRVPSPTKNPLGSRQDYGFSESIFDQAGMNTSPTIRRRRRPTDNFGGSLLDKLEKFDNPLGLYRGGIVYASNGALMPFKSRGTDTVPAMLTPGEFVVNRDATSKFLPTLRAINNGYSNHNQMVNHLAGGGMVKGPQYLQAGGITGRGSNNGVSVGSKIEGMEEFKAMIAEFNQAVSGGTENMNNVVSQISQASTAFSATAQSVNEAATNIPDRVNVAQNLRVDGIPDTLNDFSNNLLNSSVAQSTQQTAQQFNDLNTKNEGSLGLPSPNNNAFIA